MNAESMAYVAGDPNQPGAAWAVSMDLPEYRKDTAKTIAEWIEKGANVQRVPRSVALEMLDKWMRPAKQADLLEGSK